MIKTDIKVPIGYDTEDIKAAIVSHLPIERRELTNLRIIKRKEAYNNGSKLLGFRT